MSQPRTSKRVKRTPTKILESVRLDLTLSSSEDELIFETPAVVKVKSASRTWAVASGSGETRLGANVGGTGGAGGREWEVSRVEARGEEGHWDAEGGRAAALADSGCVSIVY
jgi:hypothetical protein